MSPRSARRKRWLPTAAALAIAAGLVVMESMAPATALVVPAARGSSAAAAAANTGHMSHAELSKIIASDLKASGSTHSSSVTKTGPYMYDPQTKSNYPNPSTITVSQTSDLVNQFVNVSWTNFTPSNNRGEEGGYSGQTTLYPVEVSECAGTDPTSTADCYGASGAIQQTFAAAGPTTEVYALTTKDGTGTVPIQIETYSQNSVLGCSVSKQCSLLILPVDGGDPGQPPKVASDCSDHKLDQLSPQATMNGIVTQDAYGQMLDTCAWADRVVVPLSFAPTPSDCDFANPNFSVVGSPMLARAMTSWQSALCLGKDPINISYVGSDSEFTARQLFLAGANDVGLTTEPATGVTTTSNGHHFTYAPLGITAAAFAYWMDDPATGQPYTTLNMTPELIAKLITTSYNFALYACTPKIPDPPPPGCNNAVEHNPENLFTDPAFKLINKGIHPTVDPDFSDFPTLLSGNSDMTDEVTRWVAANSAAASFVAGEPDPYGMRVNINYQGTTLPEQQFQAEDPFEAWNHSFSPQFPLAKVVLYQSLNWDPGVSIQPVVDGSGPPSYPANSVETPGTRDLDAILDLADATADDMPVAALQNYKGDFVLPTEQNMLAAVSDMTTNADGITQDDSETAKSADAYPWTMVVYAMVPTSGLSHAKAVSISRWLDFVAGQGQVQGTTPGQLPGGYTPLTSKQRSQTLKAAYEVLHQTGTSPPSDHKSGGSSGNSGGGSSGSGGKGGGKSSSPTPSSSPTQGAKTNAAFSSPDSSGAGRLVLPILLIVGILLALAGPSALVLGKPGGRAAVAAGWNHVRHLPTSLLGRNK
jgi:hypothetical protein